MNRIGLLVLAFLIALHAVSAFEVQAGAGRIEGAVIREDGSGIAGVGVAIDGTSEVSLTDAKGEFAFRNVREGSYALSFTLLDNHATRANVVVEAGKTTSVDQVVDWIVNYVETLTVRSVSRRRERIVDAPAAVTSVGEGEIGRQPAEGQLPKLLEFTTVDFGQSQLYDFSISTRGFNRAMSRRVRVLKDGRDVADPFTQAPEWATLALPLDDLDDVELQRGPSAALYGTNSTSGVMSMTTRAPRDNPGGRVRVAAGEGSTMHLDFRWAGGIGSEWYLKAVGSRRTEDYYAVSRLSSVEYSEPCTTFGQVNCLPLDAVPLPEDNIDISTVGVRFDKYLRGGSALTFEGGTTDYGGTVFTNTGGTRGQITNTKLPWGRFNFHTEHWNVLAYYQQRESDSVEVSSGGLFHLESSNARVQLQTNWAFANDRVRLVAGAWVERDKIDTAAARERIENDEQSVYAQVDWNVTKGIKLIGAASLDNSDLYDLQISPKLGLVWSVNPKQTLRLTYNKAFQVPSYLEYFLYWSMGPDLNQPPIDLAPLDAICGGCGLDAVPPLALGNESLELEQTQMLELGYKGILGNKAFLAVDLYQSRNDDFSTSFIPQVTAAGRTNENYGLWEPDPIYNVSPAQVQAIRAGAEALLPAGWMLTNLDSESIALALSVTNLGRVDTRGVDVELVYYPIEPFRISFGYSWFDFDIKQSALNIEAVVWPNAPEHKTFLGFAYVAPKWDVNIRGRWTDDFRWANGAMDGIVEAYTTVDLSGNYRITRHWMVGAHVTNLLDNTHWETFGGSLPPRRALAHVTFDW